MGIKLNIVILLVAFGHFGDFVEARHRRLASKAEQAVKSVDDKVVQSAEDKIVKTAEEDIIEKPAEDNTEKSAEDKSEEPVEDKSVESVEDKSIETDGEEETSQTNRGTAEIPVVNTTIDTVGDTSLDTTEVVNSEDKDGQFVDAPKQEDTGTGVQESNPQIDDGTKEGVNEHHKRRHDRKHATSAHTKSQNHQEAKNTSNTERKTESEDERINVDFPTTGFQGVTSGEKPQQSQNQTTEEKQIAPVYKSLSCPTCTRSEQEKKLRIEKVKTSILRRLGLTSAPKVDSPIHPLPFDFYMGEDFAVNDKGKEEEEDIDEHSVRTREIFIFGKDITDQCIQKKGTGCYSFNISDQIVNPRAIASVELWVYKQADLNDHYLQTFMVSELSKQVKGKKEYLRPRNIVKRIETRLKYGWMKIYVKRAVLRWLSKPQRNNGFAVTCQTCKRRNHRAIFGDKEGHKPILVVYMKDVALKKRVRRHADCTEGGTNCCHREELEITFSEIGWNYIMAPLSIRPNYCIGSCNGHQAAYYNYTKLVQTLKQTVAYNHINLQPCCSPVSFRRPQGLIYQDNHGVVRKIDIPDLLVGECGCS